MSDQPSAELTTLRLDAQNGILEVGGRTVHLTSVERRLVALLYSRLGDSLTHRGMGRR
jgi:DNA-binding response OmpR family regulator